MQIGADDYIKKPFNMQELILRVKRFSKNIVKEEIYNYKNIIIDIKKGNLYFEEKEVKTTIKEFEFILYLIKNRGIVLSREIIMETIWRRYYDIGDRSIDNCIKRLRKKIPILNESIESVRGYGYRLK